MKGAGMCCTRKIGAGKSAGKPGRTLLMVAGPPVEMRMAMARVSAGGLGARAHVRAAVRAKDRTAGRDGGNGARGRFSTRDAAAARILAIRSSAMMSSFAEIVPDRKSVV